MSVGLLTDWDPNINWKIIIPPRRPPHRPPLESSPPPSSPPQRTGKAMMGEEEEEGGRRGEGRKTTRGERYDLVLLALYDQVRISPTCRVAHWMLSARRKKTPNNIQHGEQ